MWSYFFAYLQWNMMRETHHMQLKKYDVFHWRSTLTYSAASQTQKLSSTGSRVTTAISRLREESRIILAPSPSSSFEGPPARRISRHNIRSREWRQFGRCTTKYTRYSSLDWQVTFVKAREIDPKLLGTPRQYFHDTLLFKHRNKFLIIRPATVNEETKCLKYHKKI